MIFAVVALLSSQPADIDDLLAQHEARTSGQKVALRTIDQVRQALSVADALTDAAATTHPAVGSAIAVYKGTRAAALAPIEVYMGMSSGDLLKEQLHKGIESNLKKSMAGVITAAKVGDLKISQVDEAQAKILKQANRDGLTDGEKSALKDAFAQLTQARVGNAEKKIKTLVDTTAQTQVGLKDAAKNIVKVKAELEKLKTNQDTVEGKLDGLKNAYDRMLQAETAAAQTEAARVLARGTFEERSAFAQECLSNSARAGCENLPKKDAESLVARKQFADAATEVHQAMTTYVAGAAAIAENLGVQVPPEVNKAISVMSNGAALAAGIATGNPMAIMNSLVGVSSMFKKARPDPTTVALAAIQNQLREINSRLIRIEEKIDNNHRLVMGRFDKLDTQLSSILQFQADIANLDAKNTLNEFSASCSAAYFDVRDTSLSRPVGLKFQASWESNDDYCGAGTRNQRAACFTSVSKAEQRMFDLASRWTVPTTESATLALAIKYASSSSVPFDYVDLTAMTTTANRTNAISRIGSRNKVREDFKAIGDPAVTELLALDVKTPLTQENPRPFSLEARRLGTAVAAMFQHQSTPKERRRSLFVRAAAGLRVSALRDGIQVTNADKRPFLAFLNAASLALAKPADVPGRIQELKTQAGAVSGFDENQRELAIDVLEGFLWSRASQTTSPKKTFATLREQVHLAGSVDASGEVLSQTLQTLKLETVLVAASSSQAAEICRQDELNPVRFKRCVPAFCVLGTDICASTVDLVQARRIVPMDEDSRTAVQMAEELEAMRLIPPESTTPQPLQVAEVVRRWAARCATPASP